jgi:UDP-N-acetylglucosamine 2-epimerase (non-hydrolysing)
MHRVASVIVTHYLPRLALAAGGLMRLIHVVGARPNFMKIAPVMRALESRKGVEQLLVHTGQHYDPQMSDVFFRDLDLPKPDIYLGVGSGTHAQMTGKVMELLEPVFKDRKPDMVLVAGDVNSTLAAAIVAAKNDGPIPVAHVEAGLRSFDMTMPEEVNRILTDRISALCLTPSADGDVNLVREGVAPERIVRVGNVMIDSLRRALPVSQSMAPEVLARLGVESERYALVTLHRPANVDDPAVLSRLLDALVKVAGEVPVLFPIHPRTRKRLSEGTLGERMKATPRILLSDPLGYFEFQAVTSNAKFVLTDSGGIQEETTAMGVPCLTLRENTERPVTITEGTNTLVGRDPERIWPEVQKILNGETKAGRIPALWDGHAAVRVADAIEAFFARN